VLTAVAKSARINRRPIIHNHHRHENIDDDDDDDPIDPQLQAILDDLHDSACLFEGAYSPSSIDDDTSATTTTPPPAMSPIDSRQAPISPPISEQNGGLEPMSLDDFFFDCKSGEQPAFLNDVLFDGSDEGTGPMCCWQEEASLDGLEDLFPMIEPLHTI